MNAVALDKTAIESIFPFEIEEERDCIIAGGNYIRVIAITNYPEEVKKNNWTSELKRIKGNIAIVQHIEPTSDAVMKDYYNKAIKNKRAELDKTLDPERQLILEKEIKSAHHQLKLILDSKSGFVMFYTYILMQGQTKKEIDTLENKVMTVLTKLNLKGLVPYKMMKQAYLSCLPLQNNQLEKYTYQMSNTDAAASFYLFDDNEMCDMKPGAVIEGINERTNSYISVDYNNQKKCLNRNKFVVGTSGIGKTTFLLHDALDDIAKGNYLFILDPEDEFSKHLKPYGATTIDFGVASQYRINPLEFFASTLLADKEEDEEKFQLLSNKDKMDILIKQKIQRLTGFWEQRKSDISEVELSIIDIALTELFKKKGFYEKNPEELKHEDFPILEDLYLELKGLETTNPNDYKKIDDFITILKKDVYGSSNIFNGHTNVELNTRCIIFNLKSLQNEKKMQGACYYNLSTYLWDEITLLYKRAKKEGWKEYEARVIADEFHFILQNPAACDFFFQAYKRFRKYLAGATVASQQIVDLIQLMKDRNTDSKMDIGAAITQNSFTKVFFGMDNKGVDDLIEILKMTFSNREIALMRGKTQGKAIFVHGNKRVFLENKLPQEELRLFNPEEYEIKYKLSAKVQPDYKSNITISMDDRAQIETYWGYSA